jgi:uncharacterized protein (TIGR02996 family)
MNEEDRFLEALRQCPGDDATRSVYADWLEDRGDPRAEVLRLEQQLDACRQRLVVLKAQTDPAWLARVRRRRVDPEAPIVPGVSAAGIALGGPAEDVFTSVPPNDVEPRSGCDVYRLGPLDLWVADGKVTQVGVYFGYHGRLEGGIGIGSTIKEIEASLGRVFVNMDGDCEVRGSAGWCFITEPRSGRAGRKPPGRARVTGIFVFGPEW